VFRILHPTDFSPESEVAFAHALKLALVSGAELNLVHVTRQSAGVSWEEFPEVRRTLERWGAAAERVPGAEAVGNELRVGKILGVGAGPVGSIVDYLEAHPTELIVLATHQREGIERWLHRATAEPIARRSHEMTLFVPARATGFVSLATGVVNVRRVVVPIDHEPAPQPAVEAAATLLEGLDCTEASVILAHVGEEATVPRVRVPERGGWRWEMSARRGEPVEEIIRAAAEPPADLIVMTTQGHLGFLDALRGSTTERVLRRSPCPVLAVPVGSRAMSRLFFDREGVDANSESVREGS